MPVFKVGAKLQQHLDAKRLTGQDKIFAKDARRCYIFGCSALPPRVVPVAF